MLKNYRLIATVLVFAASIFGAVAQTNTNDHYKDVLLDGKPAKLNLTTGEITYVNGEIATSRAAKKIKDSVLENRTEIKTNLIQDVLANSETSNSENVSDTLKTVQSINNDNSTLADADSTNSREKYELKKDNSLIITESSITSIKRNKSMLNNKSTSDFHIVEEGENLYIISKFYNTTLKELIVANKLETTLINPGQKLRVRNFDFSEAEITWIVSNGDTLYSIAKKHNTTVDELKSLNGLSSNLIKIGQKLQVNQNSTLTKK